MQHNFLFIHSCSTPMDTNMNVTICGLKVYYVLSNKVQYKLFVSFTCSFFRSICTFSHFTVTALQCSSCVKLKETNLWQKTNSAACFFTKDLWWNIHYCIACCSISFSTALNSTWIQKLIKNAREWRSLVRKHIYNKTIYLFSSLTKAKL